MKKNNTFAWPNTVRGAGVRSCAVHLRSLRGHGKRPVRRFGNSGVGIPQGPGTLNTSMGFTKKFIVKERVNVKLNGSFTNISDRTNYADPVLNLANSSFDKITRAVPTEFGGARTGQVGVRIEF